jgi:hypothetical protein
MRRPASFFFLLAGFAFAAPAAASAPPHFERNGATSQLIVDGRPFLILGGELGNSTASDLDALRPHWAEFERLHLNTIVAPVSWELVEPAEGQLDWTSVDGLLADAPISPPTSSRRRPGSPGELARRLRCAGSASSHRTGRRDFLS